jgi:hypothetical protein
VLWQFPGPGDLASGQTFKLLDDAFFSPDGTQIIATQEENFAVTSLTWPLSGRCVQRTRRALYQPKAKERCLVGGPGFEPGASRSRTVWAACPTRSSRTRPTPPEYKSRRLRIRWLPLMTARCRECVTRL